MAARHPRARIARPLIVPPYPARPSDHPPGQYPSKRKRPAAAPATNNQGLINSVNNVVNANQRCYANPTTYPMNRRMPVDPNIAAAQLRVANLMFHQQGNIGHIDRHVMAYLLQNTSFANTQHLQQYAAAAAVLPSGMVLAPAATQ